MIGTHLHGNEVFPLIEARQISKTFGKGESATRALRQVSLSIRSGEMISIMGPSGCGKTTLLHVLAGIEKADEGEALIDGKPLQRMNDVQLSAFRLAYMGFVFQTYHLIPVLHALDNVALPLIGRGLADKEAKARALEALEQVGLADKAKRYPSELSGGQNQRVAIARALVGDPKVVWADEPTGALDSHTAEQVLGLLRKMNEQRRTTIVIVTHDPQIAGQTDRIVRMENGRIVSEHPGGGVSNRA
ncbi:ABC transporter ATP-binding protein [Paenibacillus ginsengarvi]|uniref:ABC transporter ATP-binding protein n=1 Tax=Paenibacillus ginsengarvi TaxID=400777 RepID=A0A3B0CFI8_9BACL|nr:ABC transporter ATP-binding protein [Paenibacillus ginsengarvi]RKN84363.1 ABC transporter ATP-binding protein [Paenibacillus ginsengarvi]